MKYLYMVLVLFLLSCEKEESYLNFTVINSEFNYKTTEESTTIFYSYNPIKVFDYQSTNIQVMTAFASEVSICHLYISGETYIFLAKNGVVYKEVATPFFNQAKVISKTLFLYRSDGDIVKEISL